MLIKAWMQHWILCMSSWYCLSPFRKLLLKWVHQNLIWWISIMKLLREASTLTSLLIFFTRSIFHLSLAVLVTDGKFWRLLRLKVPIMVVTKTLVSMTTGLLIMLPFRHALLTASGNRPFETILKNQLPCPSPRHGLLRSTRSCVTISFNICTITCAVASYVHYMISFNMCRHFCAKFVIWLQMPLIVLEFFTLLLVLHIQHVVLVSRLCRFKLSLLIFSKRGFFLRRQPRNFENMTLVARRREHFRVFLAIYLVAQLSPKRSVQVQKNSLASCQRCRHSVEPRALTCPFKHSDLIAWSLLIGHPTHKYLWGRLCLVHVCCLLSTVTVTPAETWIMSTSLWSRRCDHSVLEFKSFSLLINW